MEQTIVILMGTTISSLVFQPPPCTFDQINYEQIPSFLLINEKIRAFFFKQRSPIYLVFAHGNAEDINIVYDHLDDMSESLNVNVIGYEYPGYGGPLDAPCPSEAQCYEAIDIVYSYLTEQLSIPPKSIVLYGRSLGGGSVCYLAEKCAAASRPLGGVILQSAFTSIYRVIFDFRFSLYGDMFCNIDRLPRIQSTPIWLIHGTHDEIVPFYHAEDNFCQIPYEYRCKPLYIIGGGHNDLECLLRGENSAFAIQFRKFIHEWVQCDEEEPLN